jgi:5-methylcytosine-specific restriction protein A
MRNPAVAEYAKRQANGACDLCLAPAPFTHRQIPFLECHHVIWLSAGGDDTINNTVALCPNCHRKMHVVDAKADRQALLAHLAKREQAA